MTRRTVLAVLMWVLALAPFLHAHTGYSHVSGFHMHGLELAHTPHDPGHTFLMTDAWPADESPAIGVGAGLPKPEVKYLEIGAALLAWCFWVYWAQAVASRVWCWPSQPDPRPFTAQEGHPPPAQAPPAYC